jgi:hypothetical protein
MQIVVNGIKVEVEGLALSHEGVVWLAARQKPTDGDLFTVTYRGRHGHGGYSGTLTPGQSVNLSEGMVFNAARTGNA